MPGSLKFYVARRVDRDLAGRALAVAHRRAVRALRGAPELARRELRQPCVAIDAEHGFERVPRGRRAVHRVHRLRDDRNAREMAERVGVRQHLVAQRRFAALIARGLAAQHQVREVDVPRVRRHVRTFRHVAEIAQVALVDDLAERRLRHFVDGARRRVVDEIEQRGECAAQRHAAPAPGADVEHARHFRIDRGLVIECFGLPVERMPGRGFEATFLVGHGALQRGAHARERAARAVRAAIDAQPPAGEIFRPGRAALQGPRQSTSASSAFV